MYIGGVDPNCTVTDLRNHIMVITNSQYIDNVEISTLARKPDWASFRVRVNVNDADKILDTQNWPTGIIVRTFRKSTKTNNQRWRDQKVWPSRQNRESENTEYNENYENSKQWGSRYKRGAKRQNWRYNGAHRQDGEGWREGSSSQYYSYY